MAATTKVLSRYWNACTALSNRISLWAGGRNRNAITLAKAYNYALSVRREVEVAKLESTIDYEYLPGMIDIIREEVDDIEPYDSVCRDDMGRFLLMREDGDLVIGQPQRSICNACGTPRRGSDKITVTGG